MSLLSLFLSKIYIRPFGKENQSAFIRYIQHVRHLRTRSAIGADYFSLCRCVHILRLHYTLISGFPQVHTAHFSLCRAGRKSKLLIYQGKNSSHPYRHLIPTLLKYICWRVCFTVFRKKSCIQIYFAKSGVIRSCFNSIFTEVIA